MKIKFSHEYPKLKAPVFTTIRRWTPEKERYYRAAKHQMFIIEINGECFGEVILCSVDISSVSELHRDFLSYDTNEGQYKLPKSGKMLVLTFYKVS